MKQDSNFDLWLYLGCVALMELLELFHSWRTNLHEPNLLDTLWSLSEADFSGLPVGGSNLPAARVQLNPRQPPQKLMVS